MRSLLLTGCLLCSFVVFAQKKPLDHSVYDSWQSIDERSISANGEWVTYTVNPQEGDGVLYIHQGTAQKLMINRGYGAQFSSDSRFLFCKIKPRFADTRQARIQKKSVEELPKDSFAIINLQTGNVWKAARVKGFKQPDAGGDWVAFLKERPLTARSVNIANTKTVDSLKKLVDSLQQALLQVKTVKGGADADEEPATQGGTVGGGDLWLRNLNTGAEKIFKWVGDYTFNMQGSKLLLRTIKSRVDSGSSNLVLLVDLTTGRTDTLARHANELRTLAISDDGTRAAFLADRDTVKTGPHTWAVYLWQRGDDTARLWLGKHSAGMALGHAVSEHSPLYFSKKGQRLFLGTAPLPIAKDTGLVDIDLVKLDIWHYNDDYLQTQQLYNLQNELKRSHLALYNFEADTLLQLGSKAFLNVLTASGGDGRWAFVATDTGRRVSTQWSGSGIPRDVYGIDLITGNRQLIRRNHKGSVYPSPSGERLLLYDAAARHYLLWEGKGLRNLTATVPTKFWDEENDVPDDPSPYGLMGWHNKDSFVYVYDRYNVWRLPVAAAGKAERLIQSPIPNTVYRYQQVDTSVKYFSASSLVPINLFNKKTKESSLAQFAFNNKKLDVVEGVSPVVFRNLAKAKASDAFVYTKESFTQSPNLFYKKTSAPAQQLSATNPQQANYNWGTAELYQWTTFDGKKGTGILYKPEDFSPTKKYPVIFYFYERLSDGLHNYVAPAPVRSTPNFAFFASRGYLVMVPDILYGTGHPGKDAYNYVVSAATDLAKKPWVDGKNMALTGQSWGGYQAAYIITATPMFKAAWAGAPVANMTSAYGGIRWESGVNRQFQYEKTQSRIGATLWQRPDLYIENSPLFHLPKVKTPVVIMANDADGAVPWYQGIELFTALRRLNKPVWLLNYNGEAHGLVERKNRKDITIREQQFFDWILKGAKPAAWIVNGVPATQKGKDWGLKIIE